MSALLNLLEATILQYASQESLQLDRAQLQTLLLKLVEQQPEVADRLENLVATLGIASQGEASAEPTSGAAPTPRRPTRVNPTAIRRQVQTILHSLDYMRPSEAYWHVGSVVNELRQVLGQARVALEAGDGDNALVILEVLTEEYLAGWEMLDDSDGEASGLSGELGQLWAEVILSVELTSSQRKQWAQRLATGRKRSTSMGSTKPSMEPRQPPNKGGTIRRSDGSC